MDEDSGQNLNTETDTQPSGGYSRTRYGVLLGVLGLLLALFALSGLIGGKGKSDGSRNIGVTAGADYALRAAYGQVYMQRMSGAGSRQDNLIQSARKQARVFYRSHTPKVSGRGFIRKRIVIESDGPERAKAIDLLASRSKKTGNAVRSRNEVAMWRAIYGNAPARLSAKDVRTYRSTIESLNMGWYSHLALADLYNRAGDASQARAEINAAESSSFTLVVSLGILFVVLALAALADCVLLIAGLVVYLSRKAQPSAWRVVTRFLDPLPAAASPDAGLISGRMLEVFLFYLLAQVVTPVVLLTLVSPNAGSSALRHSIYLTLAGSVAADLIALAYLFDRLHSMRVSVTALGLRWKDGLLNALRGAVWYILLVPLMLAASILGSKLTGGVETPDNPALQLIAGATGPGERVAMYLLVAVAAPFFEELFFRGVLLNSFGLRWGVAIGVVCSSAVFALVHPFPLQFLPIFVLGAGFAFMASRTQSLIPGMVAHCIQNTICYFSIFMVLGA